MQRVEQSRNGWLEKKKGNQSDKTQSQQIQKPRTYDFFPTARAAFIGKNDGQRKDGSMNGWWMGDDSNGSNH